MSVGRAVCIALALRSNKPEGDLGGLQTNEFYVPTVDLGQKKVDPEQQK